MTNQEKIDKINAQTSTTRLSPPKGFRYSMPRLILVDDQTVRVHAKLDEPRWFRHEDEYPDWPEEEFRKGNYFSDAFYEVVDQLERDAEAVGFKIASYDITS